MYSHDSKSDPHDPVVELFSYVATGNARPVLFQVRHALAQLLTDGTETTIDLGAIPFAPGDERVLDEVLGNGEVKATLTVLGASHVQETAIPGVWRVDHFNETGETQSRFIEVTFMPEILKTQREDAALGLETLTDRLNTTRGLN
jgi:hydrogenase-1 operon protein HyaF